MPVGGKPTVRSRRVGTELRRLREAAGVTTAQAAELLSCSPAKISRIENGIVSARVVDLRLLLDRYGDQDPEHRAYLERLARESSKRGWWQDYDDTIPPYYADFIGLETDASYIKTWEPTAVPGLLHTPEYARAVMLANPAMISPDKLDNFISIRRERQARLEQEHRRPAGRRDLGGRLDHHGRQRRGAARPAQQAAGTDGPAEYQRPGASAGSGRQGEHVRLVRHVQFWQRAISKYCLRREPHQQSVPRKGSGATRLHAGLRRAAECGAQPGCLSSADHATARAASVTWRQSNEPR